jgi:hypothetical protein
MSERRNMGIADMVRGLKDAPAEEQGREVAVLEKPVAPQIERQQKRGDGKRRSGKKSDPDYSPTTVFMRNETKVTAVEHLRAQCRQRGQNPNKADLSDLIEKLVADWNRKQ